MTLRRSMLVRSALLAVLLGGTACHHGGSPGTPPLPRGVSPAMVALGDSLFNHGACMRCHAVGAVGGPRAPSLVTGPWLQSQGSYDQIVGVITRGVPKDEIKDKSHQLAMNPRGGPMNLTDPQVRALAAYVWSISRGKR